MKPNLTSTVKDVKDYLMDNYEKGTTCPCCNQTVKMYKNKLNSYMARVLIQFYHRGFKWVHPINDFNTINGDYAKLRHWDLIEDSSELPEPDKKANGLWRITNKGIHFVEGKIKVHQKARLYNNKCYGFEGDEITIQEALGTKFNFKELMEN